MSGELLYYAPGPDQAPDVEGLGLLYAGDGGGYPARTFVDRNGPDGGKGVVFTWQKGGSLGTAFEAAKWERLVGSKEVWVGFDPANPPGPEQLRRELQYPGHPVVMGGGQAWTIPVARLVDGSTGLPQKLRWNGQGWIPGEVVPAYQELFDGALMVWSAFMGQGEATLADAWRLSASAMGINYTIGAAEISALGLLTTTVCKQVIKALVDWPRVRELAEKKASALPGSGPGSAG